MIRRRPRSTLLPYTPLFRSCAIVEPADDDRVHRGQDRRADLALGDAVLAEEGALPLDRRAAVTAHRRDDERLGAERPRSEEHTSELQSRQYLRCRLLLENKN